MTRKKTIKLQQPDNSRQTTRADDRPTKVYLQEKIFTREKREEKKCYYEQDALKKINQECRACTLDSGKPS